MENRSIALKLISEAVHLDSSGFCQAAFEKYLQSLQVLAHYLNDLFLSLGYQKMLLKPSEIKRVLCMIHECSDRIGAISDKSQPIKPKSYEKNSGPVVNYPTGSVSTVRYPGLKKLQNENVRLLKSYQHRLERAKDKVARINLKLELKRHLAENDILMKKKFDEAVKQLQRERAHIMEKEMQKLVKSQQPLNEKEREKRDLYASVLDYTKTETWPCTWKMNSWEDSDMDVVKRVFQKTIRCSDHPLSQWLIMVQTNIKRSVDTTLKHYSDYQKLLPSNQLDSTYCVEEYPDEYFFRSNKDHIGGSLSKQVLSDLQSQLESISSEITDLISSVVHIFYVTYKSLLPIDSEEICLSLIESYILNPLWNNLITLYRIVNIVSEYKTVETMFMYKDCSPSEFGSLSSEAFDPKICEQCNILLKSVVDTKSLTEKSKILVNVLQLLCNTPLRQGTNQGNIVGADELMTSLSYVIVKSKLFYLSSECFALEQLFDIKFMFGEEGYALSSFSTALKYIEMKKLIDGQNNEDKTSS